MLFHVDIGHREHPGGEGAGRGAGTLDGVGIEADAPLLRDAVLGEEAFAHEPLPEELAHFHLQRTAPKRQLARIGTPVEPFVRGDPRKHRSRPAERRPDVVPAQDHHLFQGVPVGEAVRTGHEGVAARSLAPGGQPRAAGGRKQDRQNQDMTLHQFFTT